ncbi:hypothetical protein ACHQM5_007189 [Ranunculus cassubicifolius]
MEEDSGVRRTSLVPKRKNDQKAFGLALPTFFVQIPQRIESCLKSHFMRPAKEDNSIHTVLTLEKESSALLSVKMDKQLKAWKKNPSWDDQPPEVKVNTPKGSLCNLNVKVKVGLPPDAIFDIVTDPDNKRVFKNIKEVISRRVLVDDGARQIVEVEQAALWKFLWWSGTISVHVICDQNRENHSMKFTQVKTGFMKRFEGSWTIQPLFIDEKVCFPHKPKTWGDYDRCSGGKGRVASIVTLTQLIEPAILPPPPISWYLRGITTRTTEMLVTDLLAEAARIRGDLGASKDSLQGSKLLLSSNEKTVRRDDIKENWRRHRKNVKSHRKSKSLHNSHVRE